MVSWSESSLAAVSPLTATPAPSAVTAKAEARLARNVSASALSEGRTTSSSNTSVTALPAAPTVALTSAGPSVSSCGPTISINSDLPFESLGPAGPVMVEESVGEAPAVRRHILDIGGDGP